MNFKELHGEGIKLAKDLKKCETRLIEILGTINDKKMYLEYGEKNIYSYAEKYFDFSYRKTCSFLDLYRSSKFIPELKDEIKKGNSSYSKLTTILPALKKKTHEKTAQSKKDIKNLLKITKNTPRRRLEIIAKDIAPDSSALKPAPAPKYIGEGKIECIARLSKEDYVILEKAMDLISGEVGKKVDLNTFLKIVSEKVIDKKLKSGNKKAQIVVEKIDERTVVPTSKFGALEVKKEKFETGSIALHQKNRVKIPAKIRDYVYKRDGGKCRACSKTSDLTYHHIIPVHENGKNEAPNIILTCKSCHNLIHSSQIMIMKSSDQIKFKYKNPEVTTFTDYLFEKKKDEYLNKKFQKQRTTLSSSLELNLFS